LKAFIKNAEKEYEFHKQIAVENKMITFLEPCGILISHNGNNLRKKHVPSESPDPFWTQALVKNNDDHEAD